MTPDRLDVLLGRLFAHHYAASADPVDWREARALWRAFAAQRLGLAPVTTPEPSPVVWAPIDYADF